MWIRGEKKSEEKKISFNYRSWRKNYLYNDDEINNTLFTINIDSDYLLNTLYSLIICIKSGCWSKIIIF